jgi:sec-independent protein translocase protein TatA
MLLPLALFGPMEMVILLVVILLLFGNRLPGLMRSMGQGVVEFKKGINEVEDKSEADDSSEKK